MPKFETTEKAFFGLLGKSFTDKELEDIFPVAKAELDSHDKATGTLKIELNDTNRPDLWSAMGLSRALKTYLDPSKRTRYNFFSTKEKTQDSESRTLVVGPRAKEVRPYSIAFGADGCVVTEEILLALIQNQEKLCSGFGRKRRTIAMGIYRDELIKYPVHYDGADPDTTSFIPLHMEEKLTMREILEKHPKGQEYGYIIKDKPVYPHLYDDTARTLSMPPVINSADVGAVQVGDSSLFIEMSGPGLKDLILCASIMACDMADLGFRIRPIKAIFPEDTEFGREITVPYYFQEKARCTLDDVERVLGLRLTAGECIKALQRMDVDAISRQDAEGKTIIEIECPVYRNDFLHAVDVVEDIMIGHGLSNFEPTIPKDFTIGRLSKAEETGRRIKDIMTGLGFQEMMYNYLGSRKEYAVSMNMPEDRLVLVSNPMSENYEALRPSILPSLLESEAASQSAVYPHKIFEVGKVAYLDDADNSGTVTRNSLGFLAADKAMGFNDVNSLVYTLMYFLKKEYSLEPLENDGRFIEGRCAKIIVKGKTLGVFGEVHPSVLENWMCAMPAVMCEMDIDALIDSEE